MDVVVHGRNVRIHPRLRTAAQRKLSKVTRFARDAEHVDVQFAEERNPRIADHSVCAVTIRLRHGSVNAQAAAPQPEAALDRVVDKIKRQTARRKRR
jgi:ribosomal subunit interface protein